jgi:excisionase family DNA binding protein
MDRIGIKVAEMAKVLGISRALGYELARNPDFYPAFRIGNRICIDSRELEKWIAEQRGRRNDTCTD